MILQIFFPGMTFTVAATAAPTTNDSIQNLCGSNWLNVLHSDASSIGQATIEETLPSDSGYTYPMGLAVAGNRIDSATDIKLWHDVCSRVQLVVTSEDRPAVALWDNEAPQTLTTFREAFTSSDLKRDDLSDRGIKSQLKISRSTISRTLKAA